MKQTQPDGPVTVRPWQLASEQLHSRTNGPEWLTALRAAALSRLESAGLPDTHQEDWRYTSLAGYTQRWISYLSAPDRPPPVFHGDSPELPDTLATDATAVAITVLNGILAALPAGMPPGLGLHSLLDLPPDRRARMQDLLATADNSSHDSLVDLNTALLGDVILLTTKPDSRIDKPVHVRLHETTGRELSQPRLLVDVAPGSHLTLTLEHTGSSGALTNAVTRICVGHGGHLNLLRVQALPDDGMLTETTSIDVAESGSIIVTSLDLGGQMARQAITVRLAGADAEATVHGLFLADGQRHIDSRTRLDHMAPRTTSRESFRGLADDQGHGVFNGKIIVHPGAGGSRADLTNRNLLLTKTAEIDTKPELEIYVDDVRCSHGATTGQLDANAIFYLQSRGLDVATARRLLTTAFLGESLAGIASPALRAKVEARLQKRLQGRLGGDT